MNRTSARQAGPRTALMVVADTAAAASSGVDEGADLIDLTGAVPAEVAAFRQAHPGVPVCADADTDAYGGPAGLTRDPAVAAASGARLICARQEEAARSGLPPERLLIETSPAGLVAALAGGYPVLVDLPGTGTSAGPGADVPGQRDVPGRGRDTGGRAAGGGRAGRGGPERVAGSRRGADAPPAARAARPGPDRFGARGAPARADGARAGLSPPRGSGAGGRPPTDARRR